MSRLLAYGLVLSAAFIKFFPAVLMALTLRERPQLFFAINAAAAGLIALFVVAYHADLLVAYGSFPRLDYFGDTFGAVMLPYGLAMLFRGFPAVLVLVGLALATFAAAALLARRPPSTKRMSSYPRLSAYFSPSATCSWSVAFSRAKASPIAASTCCSSFRPSTRSPEPCRPTPVAGSSRRPVR